MRQLKKRRLSVYEGKAHKPPPQVSCADDQCSSPVLPLSKYCFQRILFELHVNIMEVSSAECHKIIGVAKTMISDIALYCERFSGTVVIQHICISL